MTTASHVKKYRGKKARAERNAQIINLRLQGRSHVEIAQAFSLTTRMVEIICKEALAEITLAPANELFVQQSARLEKVLSAANTRTQELRSLRRVWDEKATAAALQGEPGPSRKEILSLFNLEQ